MKFRFYNSTENSRGGAVTAGGHKLGQDTHQRGWDAGVRVAARPDEQDRDSFTLFMTGGSHKPGSVAELGRVVGSENGPKWEPAHVAPEHILHPNTLNTFVRTIADMDPDADDAQETVASLIGWAKSLVSEGAVPAAPGA